MRYIGYEDRDIRILYYLYLLEEKGMNVGSNVRLSEIFLELCKNDSELLAMVSFETCPPFSNDLHDAVFDLRQNHAISKTAPIVLTEHGINLIEKCIDNSIKDELESIFLLSVGKLCQK